MRLNTKQQVWVKAPVLHTLTLHFGDEACARQLAYAAGDTINSLLSYKLQHFATAMQLF